MPVRFEVDRDTCVGAGQCVLAAPDVFDQDDDGLVVVREDATASDPEAIRKAGHLCPSRSIVVDS
jgi:ferredoxin